MGRWKVGYEYHLDGHRHSTTRHIEAVQFLLDYDKDGWRRGYRFLDAEDRTVAYFPEVVGVVKEDADKKG